MPYRLTPFINQNYYHLFNRGVEKRQVFSVDQDYQRFLETVYYYQFKGPKPRFSTHKRFRIKDFYKNPKIIEVICYSLMPNHFHLLIRQLYDGGIEEFMKKVLNSYTKYFNTKHRRIGPLFQGQFKAVSVDTDEQLLHLSRYIHLNPYVADITNSLESYLYSSYPNFIGLRNNSLCNAEPILSFFKNPKAYMKFISDHQSYAQELERIKHLLIDIEE
ncbi:transposase [Candidatus Daviesbacteria bacterium]|nr:transposase [Candidatus Daviesbacteria bacterium]